MRSIKPKYNRKLIKFQYFIHKLNVTFSFNYFENTLPHTLLLHILKMRISIVVEYNKHYIILSN